MAQPVAVDGETPASSEAPRNDPTLRETGAPAERHASTHDAVIQIRVDDVRPNPHQPRQNFDGDGLDRLARSIREVGVMQPVIVSTITQDGAPAYLLVAGERRWRAARLAGLNTIPAIARPMDDRDVARWALIENIQREDLNPIERANGFADLISSFQLSHEEVAAQVGVERSTVSNALRLLQLHPDVQQLVIRGAISGGIAKALAGVVDPDRQVHLARKAVQQAWTVRQLESAVRQSPSTPEQPGGPGPRRSAQVADLEQTIAQQLHTKVRIRPGRRKGTGTLSIEFYSLDQFDELMARMGVRMEEG